MLPPRIPFELLARTRELRREMTFPERLLWSRIRNRQVDDLKFRRQHPFEPFILDFFCPEIQLVLEIDGQSHDDPGYDAWRTTKLKQHGMSVERFSNDDVLADLDAVVEAISELGKRLRLPDPPPTPPLKGGE